MATTSRALAQGTAPAGRGGKHRGQWLVALAAAAALGLALLAGGLALQGRRAADTPAAAPAGQVSIPGPWRGACRAGGSECLPDEVLVPGVTPVTPLPIVPTGPADEYTNGQ